MLYVVTYDVPDDTVRRRLATLLGRYGSRVQRSVFECELDRRLLADVLDQVGQELPDDSDGSVRFYRICGRCEEHALGVGELTTPEEAEAFVMM